MEHSIRKRFGQNLKFLREKEGLTQSQLAKILSEEGGKITPKSIGSYEQGHAFPLPEAISKILSFFGLKYEHLVNHELYALTDSAFQALKLSKPEFQILAISVGPDNREKIELVREKASAGYIKGFSSTSYIKQLEKFHMPWLPPEYTYRAFEIAGDSMPPIQSGSIVLGKYVEDKSGIKKGERYIIIAKDGILFKRVYTPTQSKNNAALLLTSDNPRYEPYELPMEDILEVWQFYAYVALCSDK
ncbi:MAG: LexA family transcriptional regulator [Bacteroidia bacterium]|nr:LexA family transcriptional regulator [Bacteroidia bacterium]